MTTEIRAHASDGCLAALPRKGPNRIPDDGKDFCGGLVAKRVGVVQSSDLFLFLQDWYPNALIPWEGQERRDGTFSVRASLEGEVL